MGSFKQVMFIIMYSTPFALAHGTHSGGELLTGKLSNILMNYVFPGSARSSALLATLYISVVPCIIVLVIPEFRKPKESRLLPLMVAFALGSLIGDVFVHLLPEIFQDDHGNEIIRGMLNDLDDLTLEHITDNEKSVSEALGLHLSPLSANSLLKKGSNDVVIKGFLIMCGFMVFMIIDKALRILRFEGGVESHDHGHGHSHLHSHTDSSVITDRSQGAFEKEENLGQTTGSSKDSNDDQILTKRKSSTGSDLSEHITDNVIYENETSSTSLKTSAYLNLVSGFAHNITDGFALASSFYNSKQTGITTSIAVLIHEIPHELGDFAILLTSGFSFMDAIKSQIFTTAGALLGTICGCLINELSAQDSVGAPSRALIPEIGFIPYEKETSTLSSTDLMLPITAGGFIYIFAVGVVPQLLQNTCSSRAGEVVKSLKQLACVLAGFGLMAWMGMN